MIDKDNSFKYSSVVTISPSAITGKITVVPNPVVSGTDLKVTFSAPIDGKASWRLLNNIGSVVLKNTEHLKKGNNSLSININNLPAGIYYLTVSGAGIDQKVTIQKL